MPRKVQMIEPVNVTVAALKHAKTIEAYQMIVEANTEETFNEAWNKLPQKERDRIEAIKLNAVGLPQVLTFNP